MNLARYTVLIVDDDPEIVEVLKDHFQRRNCEAVTTVNPEMVVDQLKNFQVKLMLLDLKMKQLDGFKVLSQIKEAGLKLPPTIIITGHLAQYKDQLESYGIAPGDVITKPFTFDIIERFINRKLGEQIVPAEVGSEYEDRLYQNNRCVVGMVEDHKEILQNFAEFFEERNYKVLSFSTGEKALPALRREHVDILFVDMKLPGMQGDELIGEVSRLPNPPYIIPVSVDPISPEVSARFKKLGCGDFISKPFDIIELIEQVKTVAVQRGLLG